MRSGDIGDGAGRSTGDAGPLDLDAVRADDDLIEALAAGLVPPPCGPCDPSDVEGELVALLAGWVADVRPETLLHPVPASAGVRVLDAAENAEPANAESGSAESGTAEPGSVENTTHDSDEDAKRFIGVCSWLSGESQPLSSHQPLSLLEHNEVARPVRLASWRSAAARPYLLRAAAALVAVALITSGVVAQSYDAHPGEPLWVIAKMAFPAKSHSVEAASTVSTALNTARVALESGHIEEAREAFQTVAAKLGDVDPADGRVELDHQMDYLSAQLSAAPAAMGTATETATSNTADNPLATGSAGAVIPSGPAVTPGATATLATPSTRLAPAVTSAPPVVTSGGSTTPADASSPSPPDAVLAAPSPSVDGSADLPPAPPASAPAVDPAANSAPPATAPVDSAPVTTDPPTQNLNPTTDPPQQSETSGPVVDTATNDPDTHDNPGVTSLDNSDNNHTDNSNPDNSNSDNSNSNSNNADNNGENTDSTRGDGGSPDSAAAQSPASNSSADAADVSIDGVAGSTLGQVTGVVTDTAVS